MHPILDEVFALLAKAPFPIVWFCDRWMMIDELRLPITMHVQHYASSTFEGIRAYRTPRGLAVIGLDQHLDRLFRSTKVLRMNRFNRIRVVNCGPERLKQVILDAVAVNDDGQVDSLYIRPLFFYAVDPATGFGLGVDAETIDVWVAVMVVPWGKYVGKHLRRGGAKLLVVNRDRPSAEMIDGSAKLSCGYGGWSVPAKLDASWLQCSEAIFAPNGRVKDGTGQEFIVLVNRDGRETFQVLDAQQQNILPSITKRFLFEGTLPPHCPPVEVVPELRISDCRRWSGAAIVGTASEVTPVTRLVLADPNYEYIVGEVDVGTGRPHRKILELAEFYRRVVHGAYREYDQFRTMVPPREEALGRLEAAATERVCQLLMSQVR
ncbi:MAG: aminotransferase class IV [Candidatus Kerfeldbacteria bacterium]|nr:aminotransferase class IV [Candidatus Kerfeldbacteria bacterium]